MNNNKTKKLTTAAMLCAPAYAAASIGRIPVVLFLRYDSKDVVIMIRGLLFGPLTSLAITIIVSIAQMFTINATGFLDCIMDIISSCCFAGPAFVIAYIVISNAHFPGLAISLFSRLYHLPHPVKIRNRCHQIRQVSQKYYKQENPHEQHRTPFHLQSP